jgi:hypothetical protein
MSYASTSVAPDSFPGVRRKFTTGVAVAGAGILALGLVVVPPDFDDARIELRTVQYTSLALPSAPSPAVERFVENLIGTQARVPIPVLSGDAAGLTASSPTISHASTGARLSATGTEALALTTESALVDNVALAETPTGGSILDPILPIIGPIILFAPLFIILIPVLPLLLPGAIVFWIQSGALFLSELISPPPDLAAAPSAIVEAKAVVASDRLPSDPGSDALATKQRPKGTPAAENVASQKHSDTTVPAPSSAKDRIPAESTASGADVVKPAKEVQSPESEKPAVRSATNSSVARGLAGGRERAADHDTGRSPTKTATGGKKARNQGASVAEAEHPSGDNSKNVNTSDDDAEGS